MHHLQVSDFLQHSKQFPVLDVRSPGEYHHAHIPGAYSFPLFTDEERKEVGTGYKQQGRQTAIKAGLTYFGPKMAQMVEDAEKIINYRSQNNSVLLHCWRGGMRSAGVAWLLDLYGFDVYILQGGYKAYRSWVLAQFEKQYPLNILGGYTGSGKTGFLKNMVAKGHTVIDLEDIAKHKGSAFGALKEPQPSQEMFENILALQLFEANKAPKNGVIWLENESQRIGDLNLPNVFYEAMKNAPVYLLEVPFEERLKHIVTEYGIQSKEDLVKAIQRIQKRLGGLDTKNALKYLNEDNIKESFRILLKYYDKQYEKSRNNEPNVPNINELLRL